MIKRRMTENKPLPTIFDEEVVPLAPSRIALHDIESGDTYTFREMRDHSRRVANYFQVSDVLKERNNAIASIAVTWLQAW